MPDVYEQVFELTPKPNVTVLGGVAAALGNWVRERLPGIDTLVATEPWADRGDGYVARWEPWADGERAIGEFLWRQHDPRPPVIHWTTQVTVVASPGEPTRVLCRIGNTGPEIGQPGMRLTTRPRLPFFLTDGFEVLVDGAPLGAPTRNLRPPDVPDFIKYDLFDSVRREPLLLVAAPAPNRHLVPPTQLVQDFTGLARVVALSVPAAARFTAEVGTIALALPPGHARLVFPGVTRERPNDPAALFTPPRWRDKTIRFRLAESLALYTTRRFRSDPRVPLFRDERAFAYEQRRRHEREAMAGELRKVLAEGSASVRLKTALAEVTRLQGELQQMEAAWQGDVDLLAEERRRTDALEHKVRALQYQFEQARATGTVEATEQAASAHVAPAPVSVAAAVAEAQRRHPDALRFLPSAFTSSANALFERPEELLTAFDIMASLARDAGANGGSLGKRLELAFDQHGLNFAPGIAKNSSKAMRAQYESVDEGGQKHFFPLHLRFGISRDTAHTARIYFHGDLLKHGLFVIGHVGDHLTTRMTD